MKIKIKEEFSCKENMFMLGCQTWFDAGQGYSAMSNPSKDLCI